MMTPFSVARNIYTQNLIELDSINLRVINNSKLEIGKSFKSGQYSSLSVQIWKNSVVWKSRYMEKGPFKI